MGVITISRGSYSKGKEIAEKLAKKLEYGKHIQKKVWRSPILAMFIVTLLGTLFQQGLYILVLQISGADIPLGISLDHVTLPSLLLNLIFALPVYAVVSELVGRIYPLEVET